MSLYNFFSDEETKGMAPDICFKLDRARGYFGAPIVLTCGYRTPEHNAEIGGVPNSSHCKGMAADIKAPADQQMREKLMWALGAAGFRRVESAPHHFHVDVDTEKPFPCWWIGDDK
jgi:zinc D-Ala-D-Ala carboxypeptidase